MRCPPHRWRAIYRRGKGPRYVCRDCGRKPHYWTAAEIAQAKDRAHWAQKLDLVQMKDECADPQEPARSGGRLRRSRPPPRGQHLGDLLRRQEAALRIHARRLRRRKTGPTGPRKESAPVSAQNFDEELGRKIARAKARDKIWALEGYALRQVMSYLSMP